MRRAANPWDRFYKDQVAPWRGERDLEPLRPYLAGAILELGCGNGKLLKPLEAAGLHVVPLDVSWHAVARLGRGLMADASSLPFDAGSFGTVLDIHCTGHLDPAGRSAAAEEAFRVLQPGGHLVVRRLGNGDMRATKGEVVLGDPDARRLADGRVTHFGDEGSVAAPLQDAGFTIVASETIRHHPRLRNQRVQRENVQVICRKPKEQPRD